MFAKNLEVTQTNLMRTYVGALKNLKITQDTHFDVTYEQNIKNVKPNLPVPPTIQELMKSIVVYVEVRTGEDNRSSGVKKVIAALGAKVNDKLLRNTTHVIFKDGLLSTYKKAKNWNIPIVSILWIEACKEQRKICDPKEYSISNVDRYENPELYEKMKRFKSMQPGSECNKKRARNKTTIIKSLVMSNGLSSSEKSNASNLFKQVTPKFGVPLIETKEDTNEFFDSPASILLRKMTSETNTPVAFLTPGTNVVQVLNSYSGAAKELFPDTAKQNLNPTNNSTKILDKEALIEPLKLVTSSQDSGVSNANYEKSVCNNNVDSKNQNNCSANDRTTLLPDTTTQQINNQEDKTCMHTKRNDECISSIADIVTNSKDSLEIDYNKGKSKTQQITTNMEVTIVTNIHTVEDEQKSKTVVRNQNVKKIPKTRLSKRKTKYLNKTIETSNIEKITITKQNKQKTLKRRTVYTPQNMEETFSLDAYNERNVLTDNVMCTNQTLAAKKDEDIRDIITKKKSGLFEEDTKCSANETLDSKLNTSEFTDANILEEKTLNEQELNESSINNLDPESNSENIFNEQQCTSTPFSSTRKPGRRRTFYDLTMDLITHRIQSINKTTRKSIFGENLANESKKYKNIESAKCELNKSATTPNLPSQLLRSTLELESNENDSEQCNIEGLNKNESKTSITTKKRKLFVPQNLEEILTPKSNVTSKNLSSSKRRKTMNHIICHEPKNQTEKSTGELERLEKIKQTEEPLELLSSKQKEVVELKQTDLSTNVNNVAISKAKKIEKLPITVPTETSDTTASKPKINYFLVYTNMHKLQIKEIQKAITKLGKFHIENSVSEATTHVVSLEPRRTLNLLRALARGLWILEYRWITESLKSGKWLLEEPYEIKDFSRAVVICRSERQAFGTFYRCELFNHIGAFYISSRCGPISRENLRELILLCGGKISTNRRHAKYILGDVNKSFDEKIYVTPYWILDSITHMQLQKINKYSVPADMIKPTQISSQTPLEKEVFHIQNSLKAKKLEVSSGMRYT